MSKSYIRLHEVLERYYISLQMPKGLPTEASVDLNQLEDFIDDLFMVEVVGDAFKFSFMGKNIIKAYGYSSTEGFLSKIIYPPQNSAFKKFEKIVKEKQDMLDEGDFENDEGTTIKYRQHLFPLTNVEGSDEVKFIFGGMRWKQY